MKRGWMFAAFGLVLTLVIGFLVAGLVTHEEPTMAHPERAWDSMPLSVSCGGYVPAEDGACETAADVVSTINSRLGFEAMAWTTQGPAAVVVTMRAPVGTGEDACQAPGECFKLHRAGDILTSCEVRTANVSGGASDLEWLALYHGLGHCLGLAHDDYPLSIMRPVQRPTEPGSLPPWLSDADRHAIRAQYLD